MMPLRSDRRLLNLPMLLKIIGWLLCIEAAFLLVPTFVALGCGEEDGLPFAGTALFTALAGVLLSRATRPRRRHLGKRDGFILTASVWVVFSLFGMLPFLAGSTRLSFTDAFFEAISGFTTTGASLVRDISQLGYAMHIWRAMMQWIGGMGIIIFTLAIIPMLNHSGGMQMFNAEVTGVTHDKIKPRISQTAKLLWSMYLLLTVACVLLLWTGPMNLFDSVCHAFGTVSTGGYTTRDVGIDAWDGTAYVRVVLTVFMFISGINFVLLYRICTGHFDTLRSSDVLRTYVGVIVVMFILFFASICHGSGMHDLAGVTIDPLFHIVSSVTSTGFKLEAFENWGPLPMALTVALMLSGACAGSTSGGVKIDRLLFMFRNMRNEVNRCIYPNAILPVKVNGKVASRDMVIKVMAFIGLYLMLTICGGMLIAACGVSVSDSFFSAFSCIGNIGFGAGVNGAGCDYRLLPDAAKWVLSLLMLTGRLEIFTVLVLFTPAFWRK